MIYLEWLSANESHLTFNPFITLRTSAAPQRLSSMATNQNIYVQTVYMRAIHVIPECKALPSSVTSGRYICTDQTSSVVWFSPGCLQVNVTSKFYKTIEKILEK